MGSSGLSADQIAIAIASLAAAGLVWAGVTLWRQGRMGSAGLLLALAALVVVGIWIFATLTIRLF